jgi:DNA-binding MarR family transcriptional regulator
MFCLCHELIVHDSVTAVRDQFRILLDRVTPFFQDRLRDIPPQERAVLETMATMRDMEKTPGSIAERMRMKLNQVSTLLKRLTAAKHVRSSPHPNDKRKQVYVIAEGFFDLWLWMNLSRGARERLPFILDFFAMFYPTWLEREKKRQELREKYGPASEVVNGSVTPGTGNAFEINEPQWKLPGIYVEYEVVLHDENAAGRISATSQGIVRVMTESEQQRRLAKQKAKHKPKL